MRFELKKTLIGVAALSLLLPVASHAQTTKGPWIFDGFNRSPRDGLGSTCVSAGGADHAFDAMNCTTAAGAAQVAREAAIAARQAADQEAKAAYAAKAAAWQDKLLEVEPGSGLKPGQHGAYAYDGANDADIRDGFGRNCIKDGRWGVPLATESCEPELYSKWRAKQPRAYEPDLARRLPYTAEKADRSALKSSIADEDLAKRIDQPPPLKARSALDDMDRSPGAAPPPEPFKAEAAPIVDNSLPDFPVTKYDGGGAGVVAGAAGVAGVAALASGDKSSADDAEDLTDAGPAEIYADDDVTPDMMLSDADRALPDDGIPDDNRPLPDDDILEDGPAAVFADEYELVTPDMMLSDADRALPGDGIQGADMAMPGDDPEAEGPAEVYADDAEMVIPDMMLSDADRALPGDSIQGADMAMPGDDPEAEGPAEVYADDAEMVTPDMMLSDADRALPPETAAPVAETPKPKPAPAVAPRDETMADFPVTKYELPKAAEAPKAAAAPKAAPKPPTELPVTIKSDGLFGFDRSDLRNELVIKLDAVADMLNGAKYDKITVVGHADPIGSAKYNQALSERRAAAVKKYLEGKGVDGSRISTSGKGESELVVKYQDCAGKRKKALIKCFEPNRRVVIDAAGTRTAK